MGGVFGVCSNNECVTDLFFGTDYHSHLGTQHGGMAVYDGRFFYRTTHNIENTPFRSQLESEIGNLKGKIGLGSISDNDPQPVVLRSRIGTFAIATVGHISNAEQLTQKLISDNNAHFTELKEGQTNITEIVASLICTKGSIADGILYAQSVIEGSITMLVCADDGIYAMRDKMGRTPLSIGRKDGAHCISFESFAFINLGYESCYELGPGEVVFLRANSIESIAKPRDEMRICAFLWTYYGYPTSEYEGINVESMRYKCGRSLAAQDEANGAFPKTDCVAGVPDSGTPYAIGYATQSGVPFARPLIKYTPTWPRSFMPHDETIRSFIARMKLIPVDSLISQKSLLLVEDSIVRGTQMRGITDFLYARGVQELHIRPACPPIMFNCKFLNFTRSVSENELISRQAVNDLEGVENCTDLSGYTEFGSQRYNNMVDTIRQKLNLTTLEYLSLDGLLDSIGLDRCNLCTYCWSGKE